MTTEASQFRKLPVFNGWTVDTRLGEFRRVMSRKDPSGEEVNWMDTISFAEGEAGYGRILNVKGPNCPWDDCLKPVTEYDWHGEDTGDGTYDPEEEKHDLVGPMGGWNQENYSCQNCERVLLHDEQSAIDFAHGLEVEFSFDTVVDQADYRKPLVTA
jgi:hypothetical protein